MVLFAACLLQVTEPSYTRVLDCCEKAIVLSPSNVKALFRKGVALYHLQKSEEALAVLKQASSLPGGTKGKLMLLHTGKRHRSVFKILQVTNNLLHTFHLDHAACWVCYITLYFNKKLIPHHHVELYAA